MKTNDLQSSQVPHTEGAPCTWLRCVRGTGAALGALVKIVGQVLPGSIYLTS